MKRIKWDIEEVVAMVDLYFKFENGEIADLNAELENLSKKLNRRADVLGIAHDEKFRNLNGMKCIFQNVRYFATDGETGLANGNKLQGEVVDLYFNYRKFFDKILNDFNEKYS